MKLFKSFICIIAFMTIMSAELFPAEAVDCTLTPDDPICLCLVNGDNCPSVSGVVVDKAGNAVTGIRVNIWSKDMMAGNGIETDSKGAFSIPVPKGTGYDIHVDSNPEKEVMGGFFLDEDGDGTGTITHNWDARTILNVGPDGIANLRINLKSGVMVKGHILGPDGKPVMMAGQDESGNPINIYPRIHVWSDKTMNGGGGEADENGSFAVQVPEGPEYHINVETPLGLGMLNGFFKDQTPDDGLWAGYLTGNWEDKTVIDVGPDGVNGIQINLKPGIKVSGIVLDSTGKPVKGIGPDGNPIFPWIRAWSDKIKNGGGGPVNENGTFSFLVPEGSAYDFRIEAPLGTNYIGGFFKDKDNGNGSNPGNDNKWLGNAVGSPKDKTLIDVSPNGLSNMKIFLENGVRIFGKITDSEGNPVPDIWLEAHSEMKHAGGGTSTDDQGKYSIAVSPGLDYIFGIWPDEKSDFIGGFLKSETLNGIVNHHLVPNWENADQLKVADDMELNVVLNRGCFIKGRVTDREGVPVPGIWVEASSKEFHEVFGASTDKEGFYKIVVPPSNIPKYRVVVWGDGIYQTNFGENTGIWENAEPVPCPAPGIDFILSKGDTISGVISGLQPKEIASIHAWSEKNKNGGNIEVIGTGQPVNFKIGGLAPGDDYRIDVWAEGYRGGFLNNNGGLGAWENANLFPSNATEVQIMMSAGKTICGTLSGLSPGTNAWLDAWSEETGSWGEIKVSADNSGSAPYCIDGLASAKDFRVSVHSKDYKHGFFGGANSPLVPWDSAVFIDTSTGNVQGIDMVMSQGRKIMGTITGLGQGESASIEAFSEKTGAWGGIEVKGTGSPVPYVIAGLGAAPDIRVSIHAEEYIEGFYNPGRPGGIAQWENAELLNTTAGDVNKIDFTLSKGQPISGWITGLEAGESAWLDAWSESGSWGEVKVTGSGSGKDVYTIPGLGNASDYVVWFKPEKHTHTCRENVAIGAKDVNFNASAGNSISGRIEGAPPNKWLWIDAFSEASGGHGVDIKTDKNGNADYEIKGLAPDSGYIVGLYSDQKHLFYDHTPFWNKAAKVDISSGSATGINFIIGNVQAKFYTLSGTIAGLNEDVVVNIDAWDEDTGAWGGAIRNGNGEFSIEHLPQGNYHVSINVHGFAEALYNGSGLTHDWKTAVKVPMNKDMNIGELSFAANVHAGYGMTGIVKDSSALPAVKAMVEVCNTANCISILTNPTGLYELTGLQNGTYNVFVTGINATGAEEKFEGTVSIDGSDVSYDINLVPVTK